MNGSGRNETPLIPGKVKIEQRSHNTAHRAVAPENGTELNHATLPESLKSQLSRGRNFWFMSDLISYRLEDEYCWRLSADRLPDVLQSHATKVDGLPGLGDCMRRLVEMLVDNDYHSLKLDRADALGGCVILVMDRRNARVARTRIEKYGLDSDSYAEGFIFRYPELEDYGTEGIHACVRYLSQQYGHLESHDDKLIIVSASAGTGDLTDDAPYWPNGGD